MSTKGNDNAARGEAGFGALRGETLPSDNGFLTRARARAGLFQRLCALIAQRHAGGAGVILRFERVRPRRARRFQPLRSQEITPRISRPDDPRAEALEIRHRLDGRGVPAGGDAGRAAALCLPDLRRRLQGSDDIGLSGAVAARRALHGLCADRVSGRGRRGLVAGARSGDRARKPHQPGDRPQGDGISISRTRAEKYQLYDFLESWLRSLPPADLSAAINDLCRRYSVDLCGAVARGCDGLGRSGNAGGRSAGDDRQRDGELSGAVEPEGCRRAARDDDGHGGGAAPRSTATSGISPIRSAIALRGGGSTSRWPEEAGFVSAVSAMPGVVEPAGRTNLHALPRIAWDGRLRSLRAMRVMLSGAMLPRSASGRKQRGRPAPARPDEHLASRSGVRPRHPADDRHRRQHPADAGDDIEDGLQPAGIRQPRRLRHRHPQQRPHHHQQSRATVPMNLRVRMVMTEMCGSRRERALRAGRGGL